MHAKTGYSILMCFLSVGMFINSPLLIRLLSACFRFVRELSVPVCSLMQWQWTVGLNPVDARRTRRNDNEIADAATNPQPGPVHTYAIDEGTGNSIQNYLPAASRSFLGGGDAKISYSSIALGRRCCCCCCCCGFWLRLRKLRSWSEGASQKVPFESPHRSLMS